MNGPGHYREAERLISLIRELPEPSAGSPTASVDAALVVQGSLSLAAQAQVHATLALASAQIETAFAVAYPQQGIRPDWVGAVA